MGEETYGTLTVLTTVDCCNIDGKQMRKRVVVERFFSCTRAQSTGLMKDIQGMNKNVRLQGEWRVVEYVF